MKEACFHWKCEENIFIICSITHNLHRLLFTTLFFLFAFSVLSKLSAFSLPSSCSLPPPRHVSGEIWTRKMSESLAGEKHLGLVWSVEGQQALSFWSRQPDFSGSLFSVAEHYIVRKKPWNKSRMHHMTFLVFLLVEHSSILVMVIYRFFFFLKSLQVKIRFYVFNLSMIDR